MGRTRTTRVAPRDAYVRLRDLVEEMLDFFLEATGAQEPGARPRVRRGVERRASRGTSRPSGRSPSSGRQGNRGYSRAFPTLESIRATSRAAASAGFSSSSKVLFC